MTRLKKNRQVNPDDTKNVAVETLEPAEQGQIVHLKEFGFVRLFRTVAKNGDGGCAKWRSHSRDRVTNKIEMTEEGRQEWERQSFKIENYHRGLKQCCACEMAPPFARVERCQCRSKVKQHGHILLSLRAFIRLEANRLATGVSWYEAKLDIVRDAIKHYLTRILG